MRHKIARAWTYCWPWLDTVEYTPYHCHWVLAVRIWLLIDLKQSKAFLPRHSAFRSVAIMVLIGNRQFIVQRSSWLYALSLCYRNELCYAWFRSHNSKLSGGAHYSVWPCSLGECVQLSTLWLYHAWRLRRWPILNTASFHLGDTQRLNWRAGNGCGSLFMGSPFLILVFYAITGVLLIQALC